MLMLNGNGKQSVSGIEFKFMKAHGLVRILISVAAFCACTGCDVKPSANELITIACSPTQLASNEWSVLCVSQVYLKNEPSVQLDVSRLENIASYALVIDVTEEANAAIPKRRLQVYRILVPSGTNLTLDAKCFTNLPSNYFLQNINIKGASLR